MRGDEEVNSWSVALLLIHYAEVIKRGGTAYVLVQRGFPHVALNVAKSKRELKQSIAYVKLKRMTFNQWALKIKRGSQ